MTAMNYIEGVFRLTKPLHCAMGTRKEGNANLTLTMSRPIITVEGKDDIPFFPGNDLRGRIRRFAARAVLDRVIQDKKITRELYSGMTAGAASAQPDNSVLTVEEAVRGRDNIFMGLVGGGARMLRSKFSVCDLVPVLRSTVDAGEVPEHYAETGDDSFVPSGWNKEGRKELRGFELLHQYQFIRVDDVFRVLNSADLETYIAEATNVVSTYQGLTVANKKARQAEDSDIKKTDLGNMFNVQAVASGTPMYFRVDFSDTLSDAQLGLLCMSINSLCNAQDLGGWVRVGLGRFNPSLTLCRHGEKSNLIRKNEHGLFTLDDMAAELAVAASEAIDNVTAEQLAEFYLPRKGAA